MKPLWKFGKTLRGDREPIEEQRDILRKVREQVVVRSGGVYVFPHPGLRVQFRVPNEAERLKFATVFETGGLRAAIREDLQSVGCSSDPAVSVDFKIDESVDSAAFEIIWETPGAKEPAPMPQARLRVLRGNALTAEFAITRKRTNLGRMKEVVYADGTLSRRNDIAFDAAETSVAREHAALTYEEGSGVFRLIKGQTTKAATSVSRGDRELPCDSIQGVQLKSGDELNLGKTKVLFEIVAN